jgi:hypothetical protein
MTNALIDPRPDYDRHIKAELVKLLGDDNLWGELTHYLIAAQRCRTALSQCLGYRHYDEFIALLVAIGMLRDELMAWCKANSF